LSCIAPGTAWHCWNAFLEPNKGARFAAKILFLAPFGAGYSISTVENTVDSSNSGNPVVGQAGQQDPVLIRDLPERCVNQAKKTIEERIHAL
jgi:hypothetical protein